MWCKTSLMGIALIIHMPPPLLKEEDTYFNPNNKWNVDQSSVFAARICCLNDFALNLIIRLCCLEPVTLTTSKYHVSSSGLHMDQFVSSSYFCLNCSQTLWIGATRPLVYYHGNQTIPPSSSSACLHPT